MRSAAFPHVRQPGVALPAILLCPRGAGGVECVSASHADSTVVGADHTACTRPPAYGIAGVRVSAVRRIARVLAFPRYFAEAVISPPGRHIRRRRSGVGASPVGGSAGLGDPA
jgi:hypothetical protein